MENHLSISAAAREVRLSLGRVIPPRVLSDLFYGRKFDESRCPILAGRRIIPRDYLATIEKVLRERETLKNEDMIE